MFKVEKSKENYIIYILNNLKKEDELEMIEEFGANYKEILKFECINSDEIQVIVDMNDLPIALFGCRKINNNTAEVCLLVTDEFSKHFIYFIKQAKIYLNNWLETYSRLENYVYKTNKSTIKWLKLLGFNVTDYNEKKMYFYMENKNNAKY
jgi:hypothetical protein